MTAADRPRAGISVECTVCGRRKQPTGRSAPMGSVLCHPTECGGYYLDPQVGELWPGETDAGLAPGNDKEEA